MEIEKCKICGSRPVVRAVMDFEKLVNSTSPDDFGKRTMEVACPCACNGSAFAFVMLESSDDVDEHVVRKLCVEWNARNLV